MDGYTFFNPADARQIRIERIRRLEAEHYRALLAQEEDPADEYAREAMAELERRIDHHVRALTGDELQDLPQEVHPNEPGESNGASSPQGG
jgi:hypothetical protein